MGAIGGEYMQIAVLNKPFKTTNWYDNGIIAWEEKELVKVQSHRELPHLWVCKKWDETEHIRRKNFLVVSTSHLEFINMEWQRIR